MPQNVPQARIDEYWKFRNDAPTPDLMEMATGPAGTDAAYLDGLLAVVRDDNLEPAYRALMLARPGQSEIAGALAESGHVPDPDAIWQAVETQKQAVAQHLQDLLPRLFAQMQVSDAYEPSAEQAGKRALGGAVLSLLTRLDGGAQAKAQYASASNMTLQLSALACLLEAGKGEAELAAFFEQWADDRLVIDKWFGLQVGLASPKLAASTAEKLSKHPDFNWRNPNRFRATFGALAMNHAGFHADNGHGYRLLADWLIRLDAVNPQTTARVCGAFQTWRRYDVARQDLIRAQLERIAATPDLSRDTSEMVSRMLGN